MIDIHLPWLSTFELSIPSMGEELSKTIELPEHYSYPTETFDLN